MERKRSGQPTLEDVARHAGVSTATVSRCLNAPDRLREDTRQKVFEAVEHLGYAPNFAGRALAMHRTDTMGAVVPTIDNAIFSRGIQAMQARLARDNITLLIASTNYDPEQERRQIHALVARGVDGLMLIGEARDPSLYAFLESRRLPLVLTWVWRLESPHLCVGFDNRVAARDLATEVLEMGHTRIAMISGRTRHNDRAVQRVEGVRAALHARGLRLDDAMIVEAPFELAAGTAGMQSLLSRTPRPTAVICSNDVLATGAMHGARLEGLRIPDDISIVGFDDIDLASATSPQLATMRVPHYRMGEMAAETLIRLRAGQAPPDDRHLETVFMKRGSLGPAP